MYLLRSVESYRVENEEKAKQLIEKAKHDSNFNLLKYVSEYKCKKVRSGECKGEIEEEWYKVTLTKEFTDEKEPDRVTKIFYDTVTNDFPIPVDEDEDCCEDDYCDEESEEDV